MFHKWWVWLIILLLLAAGAITLIATRQQAEIATVFNEGTPSSAIKAGQQINKDCQGSGPGTLTRLPMDESDFAFILPYGLMVGGHVTPIDHQYFSPTIFDSPRDTYPVYAMADANLVDVQPRTNNRGTEYRLVFTISCTFFYYYDLVTSLAPEVKAILGQDGRSNQTLAVKAGQLIGRIGGQTLDFAVWDTTKPLKGFIVPENYIGENWKIFTADPLDYYSPDLKTKVLAKYLRSVEPLSGKIDYDVDGKLIGNWFEEGSGGYRDFDNKREDYWYGHLAIAPDYLDPTALIFSIGSWNGGEAKQFAVSPGFADPALVGVDSGLIKYDLLHQNYIEPNGQLWSGKSLSKDLKVKTAGAPQEGCALLQMMQERKLKVETFAKRSCGTLSAFTDQAKIYNR